MVKVFCAMTLGEEKYLKALLGKLPPNKPAVLSGYQIHEQAYQDMPGLVQKIVSGTWGTEFKSYFLKKTDNPKDKIKGRIVELTDEQIKIIDDWEFEGIWYTKEKVQVKDKNGKMQEVLTYNLKNAKGNPVDMKTYNPYPVDEEKLLESARNDNLAARIARGEVK